MGRSWTRASDLGGRAAEDDAHAGKKLLVDERLSERITVCSRPQRPVRADPSEDSLHREPVAGLRVLGPASAGCLALTGSSTRPADAQLIVIENSFSLKAPRSSVTRTVNVNVPAVVGVPEMVFSRVGSSRPGGSAPATTDQV
jgi:hypothetical protein